MSDLSLTIPDEVVDAFVERIAERLGLQRGAMAAQEPEPWISADEAAAYIGKPKGRLYDLVAQGQIPYGQDGRSKLFRRSELDAYLTAHRNGGTP